MNSFELNISDVTENVAEEVWTKVFVSLSPPMPASAQAVKCCCWLQEPEAAKAVCNLKSCFLLIY